MTEPTLSPATQASVQGVVRARNDLAAWTKNLEQALADDLAADPPRLTHDEAVAIAKANEVDPPKAAPKAEPEAKNHSEKAAPEAAKPVHHDPGGARK